MLNLKLETKIQAELTGERDAGVEIGCETTKKELMGWGDSGNSNRFVGGGQCRKPGDATPMQKNKQDDRGVLRHAAALDSKTERKKKKKQKNRQHCSDPDTSTGKYAGHVRGFTDNKPAV